MGDVKVELHHFGRAHTSGDTVVYFPDLKVVAVSDVVTTGKTGPLIDYAGGGSATDWTNVLAGILALDFDAAIPGNGDVLTKADVQAYKTKFDTVIARARELVRMGVPQDQLLKQLKTDDIGWTPRVPKMDAFYAELRRRSRNDAASAPFAACRQRPPCWRKAIRIGTPNFQRSRSPAICTTSAPPIWPFT